ncbi:hypothetical protein AKJ16_DCAP16259 [Drosera capensis]
MRMVSPEKIVSDLSSAGASSPTANANVGSANWLGHAPSSKTGSPSGVGAQSLWSSLGANDCGSAQGSSQPSCRPWERGDLLRRLSTFNPANWFGKPKVASSLACARRGWVNVDVDKIECEACGASLKYELANSCTPSKVLCSFHGVSDLFLSFHATCSLTCTLCQSVPGTSNNLLVDVVGEAFSKQLDLGHRVACPWKGNSCAESLVQFPPTPPSALVGGYKDRCDGLLQFPALPVVAASVVEHMRSSGGSQIDHLLGLPMILLATDSGFKSENVSVTDVWKEDAFSIYYRAQKLISLCGWEPRWLPDIQDIEDHSVQSARNACSIGPSRERSWPKDPGTSKKAFSSTARKSSGKNKVMDPESKCESRSPLLDCGLCGATVRIWDFITVSRPARVGPNGIDIPETSKKMTLTRGMSATSGINGWIAADGAEKEQADYNDEAATTDEVKLLANADMDLNLMMASGLGSERLDSSHAFGPYHDVDMGKDLIIGQPSNSDVGDRAASFESRGPSMRKRSLDDGGSAVERGTLIAQQADSIEGTIIDRDGDEVDDAKQYSAGPSKRFHEADPVGIYASFSGAGPSSSRGFEMGADAQNVDMLLHRSEQANHLSYSRASTCVSSVVAMDTLCDSDDSMESVENYPGHADDANFSMETFRTPDANDTSELNYSAQAQHSTCLQPDAVRAGGEMGGSSTNDGEEEVLNMGTGTIYARDRFSVGVSCSSVGMGASHEAEIHGTDIFVHRDDSAADDVEPTTEIIENQGQTDEYAPGSTNDFVGEVDREDLHGDSEDTVSHSVRRADSGSKIVGSTKGDSVESGEKTNSLQFFIHDNSVHPSLSCNAVIYSVAEASKEEVSQEGNGSPADRDANPESNNKVTNGTGPQNGESNDEIIEFDPIKHHNSYCPWVNGNVAAAGCSSNSSSSSVAVALCGWQLTLDAVDAFQSAGHIHAQTVESESAASLYKDEQLASGRKLLARHSFSKSRG